MLFKIVKLIAKTSFFGVLSYKIYYFNINLNQMNTLNYYFAYQIHSFDNKKYLRYIKFYLNYFIQ